MHTPLVTSTFSAQMIATVKSQTKLGRMAMPAEIAPTYVLLASEVRSRQGCVTPRLGACRMLGLDGWCFEWMGLYAHEREG